MIFSPQDARQEMAKLLSDTWTAKAGTIVGGAVPELRFQGIEKGATPGSTKYWARFGAYMDDTRQSAFQMDETTAYGVRFQTSGVAICQVFAPMTLAGDNATFYKGAKLAELVQCVFMAANTPSGIWFRRPRIQELDNDGTFYRWNVIVDFYFDQAKGR